MLLTYGNKRPHIRKNCPLSIAKSFHRHLQIPTSFKNSTKTQYIICCDFNNVVRNGKLQSVRFLELDLIVVRNFLWEALYEKGPGLNIVFMEYCAAFCASPIASSSILNLREFSISRSLKISLLILF